MAGAMVNDRDGVAEMVLTGPWTQEATDAVSSGQVERLILNYALGFDSPSLDMLEGQPIRELVVLDPRIETLEPIHTLAPTLESLSVATSPAIEVDLERLPRLRSLRAAWPQVKRTIEAAHGLRLAALRAYDAADLKPLRPLRYVTELIFKERPRLRSLEGVSVFPELRVLGVYLAKDLDDIGDIRGAEALEQLALESCRKVGRLDDLAGCSTLRWLNVSECGDIESLLPIAGLARLEELRLFGTTRILDNDLTPIAELPQLKTLRMQSRRSYRPSVEDVQAGLPRG